MRSQRRLEIRVGLFLSLALALTLFVIWTLGSAQSLFAEHDPYSITIPDAAGISPGAKVTISGVNAGTVQTFSLNAKDRTVTVNLRISKHFENSLRQDSFAEVVTEGVLGDKLIAIAGGSQDSPRLSPGSEIPTRSGPSLQTLLGKGDNLASSLATLSKDLDKLVGNINGQLREGHLESSLAKLDSILGKIDHGNGTIGGLLNDPSLYDDVKSLIGESNENRIIRNLVRKSIKDAEKKKEEVGSN